MIDWSSSHGDSSSGDPEALLRELVAPLADEDAEQDRTIHEGQEEEGDCSSTDNDNDDDDRPPSSPPNRGGMPTNKVIESFLASGYQEWDTLHFSPKNTTPNPQQPKKKKHPAKQQQQ